MIQRLRDSTSREVVPASLARNLRPRHQARRVMVADGAAAVVAVKAKKVKERAKERTKDRSEGEATHQEAAAKVEKEGFRTRGTCVQIFR